MMNVQLQEEWRIFMLPLQFFYLSVRPVVDMRVKLQDPRTKPANGKSVSKLITLEAVPGLSISSHFLELCHLMKSIWIC